ncbi:MAG: hypothetical protein ACO28P_10630 [Ilumatobacteraceae bacterium]
MPAEDWKGIEPLAPPARIVAVPTVVALARGRSGGYYGAVLVGLMVALAGGMTDLDAPVEALNRQQLSHVGRPALRALIDTLARARARV